MKPASGFPNSNCADTSIRLRLHAAPVPGAELSQRAPGTSSLVPFTYYSSPHSTDAGELVAFGKRHGNFALPFKIDAQRRGESEYEPGYEIVETES